MTDTSDMTFFIVGINDDGAYWQSVPRLNFESWCNSRIDFVKAEKHPKFVSHMPRARHEYMVIEGRIIVPQPVQVVTSYVLPD